MIEYRTDADLKKALQDLTILVDTREKVNDHLLSWFDKNKVKYITRGLETGDYSVSLGSMTFEDEIAFERKANLDEIAGNFTAYRERFEREMLRAKANGIKLFLIIENASWNDIFLHNYRSKLTPKSFLATLLAWQARYNLSIVFCKPSETAQIIHGTSYYWVRDRLKKG